MELNADIKTERVRTGVFICDCGKEISGRIDTKALKQQVSKYPGVVYSTNQPFPCSRDGRELIKLAIKEQELDRVLIAGCTPRTVEKLFKTTAQSVGMNALCVDVADIREQCVYVHEDEPGKAFEKALDLISMGISRLNAVNPAETKTTEIIQKVLIVGGGLDGCAITHSLARNGHAVILITSEDGYESPVRLLDDGSKEIFREELKNVLKNPLVEAYTQTRVVEIDGHPGHYEVTLRQGQINKDILCGAIVIVTPSLEKHTIVSLATLLHLRFGEEGILSKERKRLRPERYREEGIFILNDSHTSEDISAGLFQVYRVSARISHFLAQKLYTVEVPVAIVDETLCTGCGNCVQYCPIDAIDLIKRESVFSLAEIDPFLCVGCGNCLVSCPVHAITIPGLEDEAILSQISALFQSDEMPRKDVYPNLKVIAFACEWGAYAAADLAGTHHFRYAPDIRLIRMNCSARFDPMHVLWAFLNGADGVILGACPPGECHYGDSNLRAQSRIQLLKEQLADRGIDPRRLHLSLIGGDDGEGFVNDVNEFILTLKEKVF